MLCWRRAQRLVRRRRRSTSFGEDDDDDDDEIGEIVSELVGAKHCVHDIEAISSIINLHPQPLHHDHQAPFCSFSSS